MRLALVFSLPFLLLTAQDGELAMTGVEVTSPSGRYAARITKVPGHEALADALSRWQLTMHDLIEGTEVWSMKYPHSAAPARYFVADDASTFVRVSDAFRDSHTVVRMDRYGDRTVERDGRDFGLERNDVVRTDTGATWLTEAGDTIEWGWVDTIHGPTLMLALESSRGWRRELDVSMGVALPPFEFGQVAVFPGFPDGTGPSGTLDIPYVNSARVPPVALATLPLRIEVIGKHSTPNWKVLAFKMTSEDEGRFVLTPYSRPPERDTMVPQVLEGFRVVAVVQGLMPGHYEFAVAGRKKTEYQSVEVLKGRMHVRLQTSGGIAGVEDMTELFKPGIVRQTRSHAAEPAGPRHLTPDEQSVFKQLVDNLPPDPRSKKSTMGADFMQYRLGWWAGDRWLELTVDDGTAEGPVKKMIEFLRRL